MDSHGGYMARLLLDLFVHKNVVKLNREWKLSDKLKKYLKCVENLPEYSDLPDDNPYPNKIWTMWLQGYDAAPPIVKACINSIKKYSDGREVIILTEDNLSKYVKLPDFIEEKYKKGFITRTHYSDLVRLELLKCYGGTWIDSTIYCVNSLGEYTSDPFVITINRITDRPLNITSYYIHSERNNYLIKCIQECLYDYWRHNNKLVEYFLLHFFHFLLVNYNQKCKEIWQKVPFRLNQTSKLLRIESYKEYNQKQIDYILSLSPIHKFSYKDDFSNLPKNCLFNKIVAPYINEDK